MVVARGGRADGNHKSEKGYRLVLTGAMDCGLGASACCGSVATAEEVEHSKFLRLCCIEGRDS